MTQEDKELLLKDLCSRLPYGGICDRLGQAKKLLSVSPYKVYCLELDNGEYMPGEYKVEDIKPYLRSMDSMTEKERKEYNEYLFHGASIGLMSNTATADELIDWLNKKMFDYRGLIPMGLAIEAPKDMYK